ncbi:glycosyltransferase [Flaviaesturariibacter aridisoli]|uniref:Glycosyltransferase subfamily 4-like N-terminal domain-containing protein n=1 Tax=Flaviaesturariibacter aridisoli TaxID=2545761 RepID=A0A4R4DWU8_9BACT|nr:glycosyltransferase [Flaviaesturariibacter aridisoli]TCZ69038.1 hypothetical protein E0486_12710 [Flaviaesturariibacter aridisoli]
MVVLLYDTEHFETLETLVRILDDGHNELHLAVPQELRARLEAAGIREGRYLQWHPLPADNAAHAEALQRLVRRVGASLLLLATVSFRHYAFARLARRLPSVRVLLGVHDATDSFRPQRGSGLRGLIRRWGLRRLTQHVSGFIVLLPEMKAYIRAENFTSKPVYVLPGRLYDEKSYRAPSLPLQIVLPGSIDPARRDYGVAERLAQRLAHTGAGVGLTIVGSLPAGAPPAWFRAYPGVVEARCDRFVPAADYAAALVASGIVWAPLPIVFRQPGRADEQYGRSKSSGTFFDAISAGRPLLLPAHVPVTEAWADCTLTYFDEAHLYYLLVALAANEAAFRRLQANGRLAAQQFTVEAVRASFAAQLAGGR